jgi:TRAP-type C4-dicarboxylate transport system permease small subunit
MLRIEKTALSLAERVNWIAAAALIAMMLLTTADVVLRFFGHPIRGTYELVGFLGTLVIAFALAYTSVEKGHIAVEFLVMKLSAKAQFLINAVNAFVAAALFAVLAWRGIIYATDLLQKSEVSLTVQVPIYPFAYGIAAGCALLCPVLLAEGLQALRSYTARRDA